MSLTLGRQGGIAQPLKKRTVGTNNIAHVYDGVNHIWPTSVVQFSDFTSVQLRYVWGSNDGLDLDTKSYYVNSPISALNYVAVGWSWNFSQLPYLYWGGDNTQSGAECIMFNIESMIDMENAMPDVMKMNLCANWYGTKKVGNVTIECTAYKGGTIVKAWQLTNYESDINTRGYYLYPLADGTIFMPDRENGGYKKCWFGEVLYSEPRNEYFRINPVDDTVIGLPDVKIRRDGGGFVHADGYCWYADKPNDKFKVWNNQVNIYNNGNIVTLLRPEPVYVDGGIYDIHQYGTALLNEDNTPYDIHGYINLMNTGFGFVAGNSEFRGQQTIKCHVPTEEGKADDGKTSIGEIKYTKLNKIGELIVYGPIED